MSTVLIPLNQGLPAAQLYEDSVGEVISDLYPDKTTASVLARPDNDELATYYVYDRATGKTIAALIEVP